MYSGIKMGNCKVCGKKLRGAKEGYCSFECMMKIPENKIIIK